MQTNHKLDSLCVAEPASIPSVALILSLPGRHSGKGALSTLASSCTHRLSGNSVRRVYTTSTTENAAVITD